MRNLRFKLVEQLITSTAVALAVMLPIVLIVAGASRSIYGLGL